jgi:hypothetical protein
MHEKELHGRRCFKFVHKIKSLTPYTTPHNLFRKSLSLILLKTCENITFPTVKWGAGNLKYATVTYPQPTQKRQLLSSLLSVTVKQNSSPEWYEGKIEHLALFYKKNKCVIYEYIQRCTITYF